MANRRSSLIIASLFLWFAVKVMVVLVRQIGDARFNCAALHQLCQDVPIFVHPRRFYLLNSPYTLSLFSTLAPAQGNTKLTLEPATTAL